MSNRKRKFEHSSKFYRDARKYAEQNYGNAESHNLVCESDPAVPIIKQTPMITELSATIDSSEMPMEEIPLNISLSGQSTNVSSLSSSPLSASPSTSLSCTSNSSFGCDEKSVREKVRLWALKHQITHIAIDDVLQIFIESGIPDIPKDSRTLLQTPRKVNIVNIAGGQYWHNGFGDIQKILSTYNTIPTKISLKFNMDGLPINRSSKTEFWPILCAINEFPNHQPIIVGIYCGMTKPKNLEDYLKLFVADLQNILQHGLMVNGKSHIEVAIYCFICDTPARSFLKGNNLI